jgi:hypothetical protein
MSQYQALTVDNEDSKNKAQDKCGLYRIYILLEDFQSLLKNSPKCGKSSCVIS